jgi:hypothetical protein
VLESADEYQEIQDLLLRHATLQATNDDLRAHQQHSAAEAEEIHVALQAFTKQKMDEILNLNYKLSQLKKQLEDYEQQAAQQVRCLLIPDMCRHACVELQTGECSTGRTASPQAIC